MSTPSDLLFSDAREALLREIRNSGGLSPSDDAFVAWLLPNVSSLENSTSLALSAAAKPQTERNYRYVAALGFAVHAASSETKARESLATSLQWLTGREPFVDGFPMAFCTDAVALIGITLGAKALRDQEVLAALAEWMSKFLSKCYQMTGVHDWQRCLFSIVLREVGAEGILPVPTVPSVADVRVALRSKGLLAASENSETEHDELHTLALLKSETAGGIGLARAALRIVAFEWIQRSMPVIVPSRASIQDVSRLLSGTSGGLRKWTWENKTRTRRIGAEARKWHIDSEYHVQNLLYFLLAPIFPDLKDEEYFPSIGQIQPRTDLFIPSLKLIIEVKFVYPTTSFQKIIGELGADASLYLAKKSQYTQIIAFVWDDTRRSEQHSVLINGLREIKGITDAVVVSRPGVMEGTGND